jgi:hypothetical protein
MIKPSLSFLPQWIGRGHLFQMIYHSRASKTWPPQSQVDVHMKLEVKIIGEKKITEKINF